MEFPDNLRYTKDHEWARIEDDEVVVGITEYAQDALGDVVYVELPEIGTETKQGEGFGVVESVKAVSDLYSPLSGTVTDTNESLSDNPELINEDPYGDGWIIRLQASEKSEFDSLLDAEAYTKFVKELEDE